MVDDVKTYYLVTAAHNEENYIEKTIVSVLNQKKKPLLWIILNDGSTDDTEKIIKCYEKSNNFIKLININDKKVKNFY